MKNILHLDLEGTIIVSYHEPLLINVEQIKAFIEKLQPDEIHIFSHALYGSKEYERYKTYIAPGIESALHIQIAQCPTVQEIMGKVQEFDSLCPDTVAQYISGYIKKQSFFQYCKHFEFVANHYLIDDCVGEELFISKNTMSVIETIPVHKLSNWEPLQLGYHSKNRYKP